MMASRMWFIMDEIMLRDTSTGCSSPRTYSSATNTLKFSGRVRLYPFSSLSRAASKDVARSSRYETIMFSSLRLRSFKMSRASWSMLLSPISSTGTTKLLLFVVVEALNVNVEDTCGYLLSHKCCSLVFFGFWTLHNYYTWWQVPILLIWGVCGWSHKHFCWFECD